MGEGEEGRVKVGEGEERKGKVGKGEEWRWKVGEGEEKVRRGGGRSAGDPLWSKVKSIFYLLHKVRHGTKHHCTVERTCIVNSLLPPPSHTHTPVIFLADGLQTMCCETEG